MKGARRVGEADALADPLFARLVAAFADDTAVTDARIFGSSGLKVSGKVFAMSVKGNLVVKLPQERVNALITSSSAEHFDPGHGRLMKEWVALPATTSAMWIGLAQEARRFVSSVK